QEIPGAGAGREQGFHLGPEGDFAATGLVQVLLALGRGAQLQGLQEEIIRSGIPGRHDRSPIGSRPPLSLSARNRRALRAKKRNWSNYFDNWRNSQARASAHRRSAAPRLMPSASAASWCERPAK